MRAHGASDDADGSGREWRKSSRSYGTGNCLEIAALRGAHVVVRDSTDPLGPVLRFASPEWNAFLAGLRSCEPSL